MSMWQQCSPWKCIESSSQAESEFEHKMEANLCEIAIWINLRDVLLAPLLLTFLSILLCIGLPCQHWAFHGLYDISVPLVTWTGWLVGHLSKQGEVEQQQWKTCQTAWERNQPRRRAIIWHKVPAQIKVASSLLGLAEPSRQHPHPSPIPQQATHSKLHLVVLAFALYELMCSLNHATFLYLKQTKQDCPIFFYLSNTVI